MKKMIGCKHKWIKDYHFINRDTEKVEEIWERCSLCGKGRIIHLRD